MKTKNYIKILPLMFICSLGGTYGTDLDEDKEVQRYQTTAGRIFKTEFCTVIRYESTPHGNVTCNNAIEKGRHSQLCFSIDMFDRFVSRQQYAVAMELPRLYQNDRTREEPKNALGRHHESLVSRYNEVEQSVSLGILQHIRDNSPRLMNGWLKTKSLQEAYGYLSAYRSTFSTVDTDRAAEIHNQSLTWLAEVQTLAVAKIVKHSQKIPMLQVFDLDLAGDERKEAYTFIAYFPEGSDIKHLIKAQFESTLSEATEKQKHLHQQTIEWVRRLAEGL